MKIWWALRALCSVQLFVRSPAHLKDLRCLSCDDNFWQEAAFYTTMTCDSLNHAWNSISSVRRRQLLQHLTSALISLRVKYATRLKMIINELKTFKTFFFSHRPPSDLARWAWDKLIKKRSASWLLKWRVVYKEIIFDISTIFFKCFMADVWCYLLSSHW